LLDDLRCVVCNVAVPLRNRSSLAARIRARPAELAAVVCRCSGPRLARVNMTLNAVGVTNTVVLHDEALQRLG
jgi:hypothetical protein